MKAYEFTTNINQGKIAIPDHYLRELTTDKNIRVILLTQEENNHQLPQSSDTPEIEEQLQLGREFMKEYRETFTALAK